MKENNKTLVNILSDRRQLRLFKRFIKSLKRIGIEDYEMPDAAAIAIENGYADEKQIENIIRLEKGSGMRSEQKLELVRGLIAKRICEYPESESSDEDPDTDDFRESLDKFLFAAYEDNGEKAELISYMERVLCCYDTYKFSTNERIKDFWISNAKMIAQTVSDKTYGSLGSATDDLILQTVCSLASDAVDNYKISATEIDWILRSENVFNIFERWENINYLCFFSDSSYANAGLLKIGNYFCVNYADGSPEDDIEVGESHLSCNKEIVYQLVSRPERYQSISEMIAVRKKNPMGDNWTDRADIVDDWIKSYDVHSKDRAGVYAVNVKRIYFKNEL